VHRRARAALIGSPAAIASVGRLCHHRHARATWRTTAFQEIRMIYEYRAYYVVPGRMPDIQRRFADITMKLFAKHGIRVVGFWETVIGESDELVYICAYDDLAHRQRVWSAFAADPEWQAAKKSTEANGPLVERVVNKIWKPTSFSPMQ